MFEQGSDARVLVTQFREVAEGEIITYAELAALLGRDPQTAARGAIQTARNRLLRDEGIAFAVVRDVGYRRLHNEEKVSASGSYVDRSRRAARRGLRLLATTEYEKLPAAKQTEHNVRMSVLGVIGHVTRDAQIKRLMGVVADAHAALPVGKTLEAFKK